MALRKPPLRLQFRHLWTAPLLNCARADRESWGPGATGPGPGQSGSVTVRPCTGTHSQHADRAARVPGSTRRQVARCRTRCTAAPCFVLASPRPTQLPDISSWKPVSEGRQPAHTMPAAAVPPRGHGSLRHGWAATLSRRPRSACLAVVLVVGMGSRVAGEFAGAVRVRPAHTRCAKCCVRCPHLAVRPCIRAFAPVCVCASPLPRRAFFLGSAEAGRPSLLRRCAPALAVLPRPCTPAGRSLGSRVRVRGLAHARADARPLLSAARGAVLRGRAACTDALTFSASRNSPALLHNVVGCPKPGRLLQDWQHSGFVGCNSSCPGRARQHVSRHRGTARRLSF